MLFIMLFAMMHNVLPHVHHDHALVDKHVIENEHHHHHHDSEHHHHSEDDEDDSEQISFFGFLLKSHSHAKHTHRFSPVTTQRIKSTKQVEVKSFVNVDLCIRIDKNLDVGWCQYLHFNDYVSSDEYISANPLRGPPMVG